MNKYIRYNEKGLQTKNKRILTTLNPMLPFSYLRNITEENFFHSCALANLVYDPDTIPLLVEERDSYLNS